MDNGNGSDSIAEYINDPTTSYGASENPKTSLIDREISSLKTSNGNVEQSENNNTSEEKTLKKPDKILPCPRCDSMETKFCYFNNYNVNQPRHFCKNCQRYWTAGGTMRNVPVGAGRRKNKNSSSASHYRHILMADPLQTARANGVYNPSSGINGAVLNFGSDSPLCESMASVLDLAEKKQNCSPNEFTRPDHSNGSSNITASTSSDGGYAPQLVPSFPGQPWPNTWSSAQWTPAIPPPALFHSSFPISFCPPPPYWGYNVQGSWNITCGPSQSSTINPSSPSSSPNSPTLGKHSREGNILCPGSGACREETDRESSIAERSIPLIPKTLRIDDPSEAAKSSIWATLGIKNDINNSPSRGGLLKAFQSKRDDKTHHGNETSPVLQANPAALSRSAKFHETT